MSRDIESVIDDAVALISSLNSLPDSIPPYNVSVFPRINFEFWKIKKKRIDYKVVYTSSFTKLVNCAIIGMVWIHFWKQELNLKSLKEE